MTPSNTWDQLFQRLKAGLAPEFLLLRELGRGGQAAVYLAEEPALRRQVAIKVLARSAYLDDELVARFQGEARTIASFNHQHIVTVYSIRTLEKIPLFIMQYIDGRTLAAVLRDDGPLPWSLAVAVLYQVATALHYAHLRKVVHRDIKPANVIFDLEGHAVVTDFGIAKRVADPSLTLSGAITSSGIILGTPAYMSPEQCQGQTITPASDQYGLGVLAYELITGKVPFSGNELMVLHAHGESEVPSIRDQVRDCPEHIEQAIVRMLSKRAADRFPSVLAALEAMGVTGIPDDSPVREALRELASPNARRRRSTATPTFGFASVAGARLSLDAPSTLEVGASTVCRVMVDYPNAPSERAEVVTGQRKATEWSISPAGSATIDQQGHITALTAGLVNIRAKLDGQLLTAWCQCVLPRPDVSEAAERRAEEINRARLTPSGSMKIIVPLTDRPGTGQFPTVERPRTADHATPALLMSESTLQRSLESEPITHAGDSAVTSTDAGAAPEGPRRSILRIGIPALVVGGIGIALLSGKGRPRQSDTTQAVPTRDSVSSDAGATANPQGSMALVNSLLVGRSAAATITWTTRPGPGQTVEWVTDNPAVARVDGKGTVRATGSGSTTIRAKVAGVSVAAHSVVVTRVAIIAVTAGPISLAVGASRDLSVQLLDVDGQSISDIAPEYSVSAGGIVQVSDGVVFARAVGAAVVTIRAEGRTRRIEVYVTESELGPR